MQFFASNQCACSDIEIADKNYQHIVENFCAYLAILLAFSLYLYSKLKYIYSEKTSDN